MRKRLAVPILLVLAASAGRTARAGDGGEEATGPIFFREPDRETGAHIAELIAQMATGSVPDREKKRRELQSIGSWSVEPLLDAVARLEPPKVCAAILVLDAIHDRRAVDPLRATVAKETAHPYVAAFATLCLGRFGDASSVEVFRSAVKTTKLELLKAAVPFAAAKIRTADARDLVIERVRAPGAKEPVKSAALVSLGFFPETALDASGARPGADLTAALASKRSGERQAALLGFLVAASARGDSKPALREVLASESVSEVASVALLGLSRSPDADVTELLAQTAARQGDSRVRELAADLLIDRVDATTRASVEQQARNATSARLRAACVLALGRLDDDTARRLVLDRLTDSAPIVRAASAVALTRRNVPGARESALAALDQRIRHGETNDDVRADLEKARSLLSGERGEVRWTEVGPEVIFSEMPLTYSQRLLRAVNLRLMASLDLTKITNLQSDTEILTPGPPSSPADSNDHSEPSGGEIDPGSADPGTPAPPADPPPGPPSGEAPSPGQQRTSQYQELRDLKLALVHRPYFGPEDLPAPPTTPGVAK